ncbi:MAG: hydroxyacylglutathione hydrolase [Alphaproteobacteria bacterium]|nr:MAG: hydroxyacylglutathione hydrolase [Alphaproteobacteria bacterium]
MDIQIIPILKDNYTYLLQSSCGTVAVLDPGEAGPVIEVLNAQGLNLDFILNTHHHWDHTDGNAALKRKYSAKIVAPEKEGALIKNIDIAVKEGDIFTLGTERAQIIETPGHTRGGICFYFKDSAAIFTGDTLFSLGCGRLFEGTAQDMFNGFQKIMALPDETMIYCGHEYTRGNAGFCLAHDRSNEDLKKRIEQIKALRANNQPTIPTSLAMEKKTNIFIRAKSAEEFAALRLKKDNF